MHIKKLSVAEIHYIWKHLFPEAFPRAEIRSWRDTQAHLANGNYEGYGCFEGGALITYAFFFKFEDVLLLDYFASLPSQRGKGVGGRFLQQLAVRLAGTAIIGEVEAPVSGDAEVDALRRRRLGFYARNGFAQQGVMSRVYGVTYRIIAHGLPADWDDAALAEKLRGLYQKLLSPWRCRWHVKIWQEPVPQAPEDAEV